MEALLKAPSFLILSCFTFVCAFGDNEFKELSDITSITANLSDRFVETCGVNETCIRFCCENSTSCDVLEFFNKSSVPGGENLKDDFKILEGLPSCHKAGNEYSNDDEWSFFPASRTSCVIEIKDL